MAEDENGTPQQQQQASATSGPVPALPRQATDDDIRDLVADIIADRVVTVVDAPLEVMRLVFLPLTLGALSDWPTELARQVMPFAVLGKHATADRSVNGYPVFFEMAVWRKDDFLRAVRIAYEATRAGKAILDAALAAPVPDAEPPC